MIVLFGISIILCLIWGRLVVSWMAIRQLGWAMCCPGAFLRSDHVYHYVHLALYGAVLFTGLMSPFSGWWLIPTFFLIFTFTRLTGQRAAFSKYRQMNRGMIDDAAAGFVNYSADELKKFHARSVIPNSVLRAELAEKMKSEMRRRR